MLALTGISSLVTNDSSLERGKLGIIENAALVVGDDQRVQFVGEATNLPREFNSIAIDINGRAVIPGFVDSHTHLVFGGDRAEEFEARMSGKPYSAGGIRTTVAATRNSNNDVLVANARRLASEALQTGTTTLETKSGYGLSVVDEMRSLQVANAITTESTFLGAHIVPAESQVNAYVDLVCGEMLAQCAPHAKWIDVFCDRGAFEVDHARAILQAGAKAGLGLRIHANQLQHGGGVQLGVELGVASCDHCTHLDQADITALADTKGKTVATLLPTAELCTRSKFPDARRLIDAGVTVALASDCNPGSSYTTSMPLVISLAVLNMNMSCDEALWSATAGGAAALRRTDIGNLAVGSHADFAILNSRSHIHLAYRPGVKLIDAVYSRGQLVAGSLR
ncbi:MAG: imidazolonepropionase [Actinobacteria bacterium]|nr:imidazolonepropionase [Actinomycetota bacterium]NDC99799.1 imidazolonepropionase [bacterium]NDF66865.1 imidazolonepropionase [Actinomycetota bacterium]